MRLLQQAHTKMGSRGYQRVTIISSYAPNGISFDKTGNLYTVTYGGDLLKHSPVTDFKYAPQAAGNYTVTTTSIDGCSTGEQVPACNNVCDTPYNLTVSNIKAHSAHFQGSVNADAVLNQLRIREVGTAKWDKYSGPQMEVTLNNLDANTRYEWQARTKCDSGFSGWVNGPQIKHIVLFDSRHLLLKKTCSLLRLVLLYCLILIRVTLTYLSI